MNTLINKRQRVRHYKREHYHREVLRSLRQLSFWIRDGGSLINGLNKVRQSYGDMIYYQLIYHFSVNLNKNNTTK